MQEPQNSIRTDWREKPEVMVNEAVSAAMNRTDPSESIDAMLSSIGQNMDADRAYIFEFLGPDYLGNTYEWCAPGVSPQIGNLNHTPVSIYQRTWMPKFHKRRAVIIPDVEAYAKEDPTVASILRPQGITNLLAIPLFLEGELVGFIGIDNPVQGAEDGMAAFLGTLASFTSVLLRHRDDARRLADLSSHDRVSGCFDTLYLLDQLEWLRKTGIPHQSNDPDYHQLGDLHNLCVLYFNLVQFKEYNGAFGMEAGNRCMQDVAKVLGQAFDTRWVSRFSADHFVVFYGGDDVRDRVRKAHRMVLELRDGFRLWLEAGISKPMDDQSFSTAVDLAKVACDQISKDGRDYINLYTGQLQEELERKKYLQDHIESAVTDGSVQVYYQPVVRTMTGRLAGVEALSRWNDAKYGPVSPSVFVPALEEKHMSWHLLTFVIDRVCADLANRMHRHLPVVPVSVNVSRTDFESCEPFDIIQKAVHKHGIPNRLICVEITESVAMGDPEGIEQVVERFRRAGFEVWMDDFGSAYSSLNTLKDFSFGKLKLDMLFMHNFNQRSKDIIGSIISMAKKLGVHTLAEGVETREQVDFLIDAGCEEIQGYYFSKPLPLDDVIDFTAKTPLETYDQRILYTRLGLMKLHTYEMCGLVYWKDGRLNALYANDRMRRNLQAVGMNSPAKVDSLLNESEGQFAETLRLYARRARANGDIEMLPFVVDRHHMRMSVQVTVENVAGCVLLVKLLDVSGAALSMDSHDGQGRLHLGKGIGAWKPVLLRDPDEKRFLAGASSAGATDGDYDDNEHMAEISELEDSLGDEGLDADGSLSLSLQNGLRTANELRHGFSIPSADPTALTVAVSRPEEDIVETFSALASIFIALINIDMETWELEPVVVSKVTKDYLYGDRLDYFHASRLFVQRSVDPAYKDIMVQFMEKDAMVERLTKYGTISIDYKGVKLGWCRLFLIPAASDDEGRPIKALFAVREINDEKSEERRMSYRLNHDPLTKAFNRNGLHTIVDTVRDSSGQMACVILDIDNFKEYNDTFGHKEGDNLLVRVTNLLVDTFGATDYVARIGGDEFVILMTRYGRDANGDDIRERIERVNETLASDWGHAFAHAEGAKPVPVSLSAGIVVSPGGYRDDLYLLADRQLYREKAAGKGGSRAMVIQPFQPVEGTDSEDPVGSSAHRPSCTSSRARMRQMARPVCQALPERAKANGPANRADCASARALATRGGRWPKVLLACDHRM